MPREGLHLAVNVKLLNPESSGYCGPLMSGVVVNVKHCCMESGQVLISTIPRFEVAGVPLGSQF